MVERDSGEIVGTSAQSSSIRRFVTTASGSSDTVMLFGEPGVGKEHVARKVHEASPRAKYPFVVIDCSLYHEPELEREVFGHGGPDAGASRRGLLEFASRGTCYLTQIEELSPTLQENLLSFLETGRFRRSGDHRELVSRARLMVSTEKNLAGFVEGGLFSGPLYNELSRLSLRIAPLRERPEDVAPAVAAMVGAAGAEDLSSGAPRFTGETLEALRSYPWPRNFDELYGEIRRLLAKRVEEVRPADLSFEVASYWLGHRGDSDVRKVVEELDGYIREFRILSRLEAEFGEALLDIEDWELESEAEVG